MFNIVIRLLAITKLNAIVMYTSLFLSLYITNVPLEYYALVNLIGTHIRQVSYETEWILCSFIHFVSHT